MILHPEDIKATIRKEYASLRDFERAFGLPDRSVRDVLRGRSSKKTSQAIAEFIGVKSLILIPRDTIKSRRMNKFNPSNGDSQRLNAGGK